MPILTLTTNIPGSKIPSDFFQTTTELLARLLNKPEKYIWVHVTPDEKYLSFAGSMDPCCFGELVSIGALGAEENKGHIVAISKHIHEKLGIPPDRFIIKFDNLPGANCGFNGVTFG